MLKRALRDNLKRWQVRISKIKLQGANITDLTFSCLSKDFIETTQIPGELFPKESFKTKGHIMNT